MTVPKALPRSSEPTDQELASRLNAWADEAAADSRQSLRTALIELTCWILAALLIAALTVVWSV